MTRTDLMRGVWPAVCPLRGSLGQTHYTHLRPTGELAVESALILPGGLTVRAFHVYGPRQHEGSDRDLVGDALPDGVIDDDLLPMAGHPELSLLDDGSWVAREGPGAHAWVVRSWIR